MDCDILAYAGEAKTFAGEIKSGIVVGALVCTFMFRLIALGDNKIY